MVGRHREVGRRHGDAHLETGGAAEFLGQGAEGAREAGLLDHRWMELVRRRAQHRAEVGELAGDPADAMHHLGGAVLGGLVQLVPDDGDALEGVVVQLAGHAGALLFLGGEDALGVGALQRDAAPLGDEQRDEEGREDDGDAERPGDEEASRGSGRGRTRDPPGDGEEGEDVEDGLDLVGADHELWRVADQ